MKRALLITASALLLAGGPAWASHRPGHRPGSGNLSAEANPFVVTFGSATTVTGRLTGRNNASQQVTLAEDPFPYGDAFVQAATATTNRNGDYSFRLLPATNRNYRVRVRGQEAFTGVRVRTRLTLSLSDSTPRRGQAVRFSGLAFPKHDGRVLLIQRRTATGRYATVRRAVLRSSTAARSSFATTLTIRSSGRYRALLGSDGDHITGISPSRFAAVG